MFDIQSLPFSTNGSLITRSTFTYLLQSREYRNCLQWGRSNVVELEPFSKPEFWDNETQSSLNRHIRNYYLSNSKTFQDGNGNGNLGKINSNDFQDGNWESMEMKE